MKVQLTGRKALWAIERAKADVRARQADLAEAEVAREGLRKEADLAKKKIASTLSVVKRFMTLSAKALVADDVVGYERAEASLAKAKAEAKKAEEQFTKAPGIGTASLEGRLDAAEISARYATSALARAEEQLAKAEADREALKAKRRVPTPAPAPSPVPTPAPAPVSTPGGKRLRFHNKGLAPAVVALRTKNVGAFLSVLPCVAETEEGRIVAKTIVEMAEAAAPLPDAPRLIMAKADKFVEKVLDADFEAIEEKKRREGEALFDLYLFMTEPEEVKRINRLADFVGAEGCRIPEVSRLALESEKERRTWIEKEAERLNTTAAHLATERIRMRREAEEEARQVRAELKEVENRRLAALSQQLQAEADRRRREAQAIAKAKAEAYTKARLETEAKNRLEAEAKAKAGFEALRRLEAFVS